MSKYVNLGCKKVFISGGFGMVGGSLRRKFIRLGMDVFSPKSSFLDLTNYEETLSYIKKIKPDFAILSAALVGGISANKKNPVDFILKNSNIYLNSLKSLLLSKCKKVLFLSSSCVYPKNSPQPMKSDFLLKGLLEGTNKPYAISKILGMGLCEAINSLPEFNYSVVIPSSLLGRADNYHSEYSHVLPSILKKAYLSKLEGRGFLDVWGTGSPLREFLDVEDFSNSIASLLLKNTLPDLLNIGSGEGISIKNLIFIVKRVVGFKGYLKFDLSKPDGMLKKVLDVRSSKLFWTKKRVLGISIQYSFRDFLLRNEF